MTRPSDSNPHHDPHAGSASARTASDANPVQASARRGQIVVVAVVIVALILAGISRNLLPKKAAGSASDGSQLDQLDSYALALLLGGLRGPLVMMLWSSSETQKSERQLEDFDTKVDLIRRLQPEFDAVHIFQIWNKAYNISVQMANLPSKYATILDAVDYGRGVMAERPENINIESAVASVYFDKLGNSAEKLYYRGRMREDSLPYDSIYQISLPESKRQDFVRAAFEAGADPSRYRLRIDPRSPADARRLVTGLRADLAERLKATLNDPEIRFEQQQRRVAAVSGDRVRVGHDTVLDAEYRVLPTLATRDADPLGVESVEWLPERGEMAYLRAFEPYPYGVPPMAIGYNYFMRALALQTSRDQRHAQISDRVISSRPALSLMVWAEEEWDRARRLEALVYGRTLPEVSSNGDMEFVTADIGLDPIRRTAAVDELLYSLDRSREIGKAAIAAFRQHILRFPSDAPTYDAQIAWIQLLDALCEADRHFLIALTLPEGQRQARLTEAARAYQVVLDRSARLVISYYVPEEIARQIIPAPWTRLDARDRMPTEIVLGVFNQIYQLGQSGDVFFASLSELQEFSRYFGRGVQRLQTLEAAGIRP